ncbi:uncharacterized protein PAC_03188 [Phialocephala subalpina]|uniref:Uncharacterized protein n=1 Tax=Phialocephala subalpina TaxID=576137 RepID=A0A1L7WKM7_9HELO|nr:uncharacterized protein PAC_03188 [Phialocephala subalpina]
MPTYNLFDLSVRLYAWEPQQFPPKIDERAYPHDASLGEAIEEVSEEYFDRYRGIDFLGQSGSPFYLVNAGRNLFFPKDQLIDGRSAIEQPATPAPPARPSFHAIKSLKYFGQTDKGQDEDSTRSRANQTPSVHFHYVAKSAGQLSQTDGAGDDDTESPLSSVPTNFDSSPVPMILGQGNDKTKGSKVNTPESKGWRFTPEKPITTKNGFIKPLDTPIPIKIQIQFSQKSFLRSFNTELQQDICINIFYNGEFVFSRSYRAETQKATTAAEKSPNFSGRRVEFRKEVPFVVAPLFKSSRRRTPTDIEGQWNRINELLLAEADEWGRTGKYNMFRSPVGEYLEDLSNLAMPEDMTKMREGGRNIGIIDVVVALGRTKVLGTGGSSSPICQPERKLPEGYCGPKKVHHAVPEETRRRRGPQSSRNFNLEDTDDGNGASGALNGGSADVFPSGGFMSTSKHTANATPSGLLSYQNEEYHIETITKSTPNGPGKRITSSQSMAMGMPPPRMSLRSPSMDESLSQTNLRNRSDPLRSMASRSKPTQQGLPDMLPKKRSRDASQIPDSSVKRRKHSTMSGEVSEGSHMRSSWMDMNLWSTPASHSGQPMVTTPGVPLGQLIVEANRRPLRQRVKTTHFNDEESPTPSGSFKQRNSKDAQTPTPALDAGNSLSGSRRGGISGPSTPNILANHGANTYKTKMFGLDGTGSGSKRVSRPSKPNGKLPTGSSVKRGPPETPESATSTPTTIDTEWGGRNMQLRSSPRNTFTALPQLKTDNTNQNQKESGVRRQDPEAILTQSLSSSVQNTRGASRSHVSGGGLKGLLDSHQPTDAVDNTFGSSFADSSANRPVRRANKKEKQVMVSDEPENEGEPEVESSPGHLQASVQKDRQRTLFIVKGLVKDDWNLVQSKPTIDPDYKSTWKRVNTWMYRDGTFKWLFAPKVGSDVEEPLVPQYTLPLPQSAASVRRQKKMMEELLQARSKGRGEVGDDSSPSTTDATDSVMNFRKNRTAAQNPSLAEESMNAEEGTYLPAKQRRVARTPVLPVSSSPTTDAMLGTPSMLRPATSLGIMSTARNTDMESTEAATACTATRSRPNLAPLTTRGYIHTDKGAKTPTPKSGTFSDHTSAKPMTRARTSSNAEMPLPSSSPPMPTPTPKENIAPSRARRGRHSLVMRISTSTMAPPPTSMARSKIIAPTTDQYIFKANSTIKDEITTPPIVPPSKPPRSTKPSREISTQPKSSPNKARPKNKHNPAGKNQYSKAEENAAPTQSILPPAKPHSTTASKDISKRVDPPKGKPHNPTGKNQHSKTEENVTSTPSILPPPNPRSTTASKEISKRVDPPKAKANNNPSGKNQHRPKEAGVEPTARRTRKVENSSASAAWKPVDTCTDSVLTYASKEQIATWLRLAYDDKKGVVTRETRAEKEGVFRAHSILMGVRYVLGADFQEIPKRDDESDKENGGMDGGENSEASNRLLEEELEEMMMS